MFAAHGCRALLGFDVRDSENEGFRTVFLRSAKIRGLDGVNRVMSDAHTVLKKAIGTVLSAADWQRWRVHFFRKVLTQPNPERIEKQVREVTSILGRSPLKVAAMLTDALSDLLAFAAFPRHRRGLCG